MLTINKLIEKYIPLANKIAYKIKKKLPSFVDIDDLRSAAYLGLVEGASRFNGSLGVQFSTFVYPRIFGAVYDYLRKQGWIKKGDLTPLMSLDAPIGKDNCSFAESIEAKPTDHIEETFEVLTCDFDYQAKNVIRHYFVEDYSMKEVGEKFGISESRISQLIKKYKKQMQSHWLQSIDQLELAA